MHLSGSNKWAKKLEMHRDAVFAERQIMYQRQMMAHHFSNKYATQNVVIFMTFLNTPVPNNSCSFTRRYLHLEMDGADQSRLSLPKPMHLAASKSFQGLSWFVSIVESV